jgi:hypothetical protein
MRNHDQLQTSKARFGSWLRVLVTTAVMTMVLALSLATPGLAASSDPDQNQNGVYCLRLVGSDVQTKTIHANTTDDKWDTGLGTWVCPSQYFLVPASYTYIPAS